MIPLNKHIILRPFVKSDAKNLAKNADNNNIAQFLTDAFPSPYKLEDAIRFIENINKNNPPNVFGIDYNGEVIGGIGIHLKEDIYRKNAEMGYWLAEPFWGQGIMTKAVEAMVNYGFENFDIHRIYACPFSNNPKSKRVLEKAGMKYEATLKEAVFKNGKFLDQLYYSVIRS